MADLDALVFRKRCINGVWCLVPSHDRAEEWLAKTKDGQEVLLSGRRPRSPQHHRLLFTLLRMGVNNSENWPSETVLLDAIKIVAGYTEPRVNPITGEIWQVPKSISFASLDQDGFNVFFGHALEVVAHILRVTVPELEAEIDAMTRERK